MIKKINHIVKLAFNKICDCFLWGRIFGLICLLPFLLRLIKIHPLLRLLTPRCNNSRADLRQKAKIIKWTDAILGWNFFIFRTSCMKRSLVLYHFLNRAGLPLQINFGVRKSVQGVQQWPVLDGHGWLSLKGRSYSEKGDPQEVFKLIYSFPPA
jgi:hypothetical protein